jgi:DNA-directed RNA polymerase specialized sigma24 family protein
MQHQSPHPPESEQNNLHLRKAGFWLSCPVMDELIKLVKTYRLTAGVADRLRLAEEIFRLIEPELRFFVFRAIQPPAAEDVLQEVLKAVAIGMKKFAGGSKEQFWAWCYRIARNKLNDHFHRQATNREQTMSQDELWQLVESSAQVSPLFRQTGTTSNMP